MNLSLPILRHMRPNMKGQHVSNLQHLLAAHGVKVDTDGVFGPGTERAVKEFQSERHLSVDGIVGSGTWRALL